MIVYGSKASLIGREATIEKCSTCGTSNSVQLMIFQKYAHVFWVPFFPIGKTAVSECQHCKQVLKQEQFPSTTLTAYDELRSRSKTPFWMFSGLALVALFIVFTSYESAQSDKRNAAYILAPKSGDVFEIKTELNQYTLYKVDDVQGDSVYIRLHQFETNKMSGLSDLKRKGDEAYSDETFGFSKSELKTMLEKGTITEIDRK